MPWSITVVLKPCKQIKWGYLGITTTIFFISLTVIHISSIIPEMQYCCWFQACWNGRQVQFSFIWLSYTNLKSKTRDVLSLTVFSPLIYQERDKYPQISLWTSEHTVSWAWVRTQLSPDLHISHANNLRGYHFCLIDVIDTSDHLSRCFWSVWMLLQVSVRFNNSVADSRLL